MKIRIISIIITLVSIINTGCSLEGISANNGSIQNTTDNISLPTPAVINNVPIPELPNLMATVNPPEDTNWLMPSKVEIRNFHEGGTAEYAIKFHNAKKEAVDKKLVTTVDNDTWGEISLSSPLYLSDIKSIISVSSNESRDKLEVRSYNIKDNSILITGFVSNSVRVVTIVYKPLTAYAVYARLPDRNNLPVSANIALGWTSVNESIMLMYPLETRENLISIVMPKDAVLPDKNFELWIGVTEVSKQSVSLELVSRWLVAMK